MTATRRGTGSLPIEFTGPEIDGTRVGAGAPGRIRQLSPAPPGSPSENDEQTGPQLAVVNLSSGFANNHPSGIETEMLTLLSICGTLHARLPIGRSLGRAAFRVLTRSRTESTGRQWPFSHSLTGNGVDPL